jgi:phage tail-like protein
MNSPANTHDRYWLLDSVAGWREASRARLQLALPGGNLVLDPLPGTASLLLDAGTQASEFKRPSALSADGSGNVFVTDAATSVVKRIDLERGSVETLPAIGGRGRAPRELWEPHGIAALPSGAVVVSDTGNHHVKIFSAVAYALLQDWGAADSMRRPRPGEAPKTFNRPWAVAVDARAGIHVVDRGNRRIQKFLEDGSWQGEIDAGPLQSPTRLAAGPDGRIAVVDAGSDAVVVTGSGTWHSLPAVDKPRSVTFDAEGRIYVGDHGGLIHVFVPDPDTQSGYRNAGAGVTGADGEIVDLIWHHAHGLIIIAHESSNGHRRRLWKVDPAEARARTGTFTTQTLDSKIDLACQWHRVLLDAEVPAGTSIQIDSLTSPNPLKDCEVTDSRQWNLCVRSGNHNPDCLIQSGPGRYLRLRLTFNSNGLKSPELRSLKVFYPRVTYLQYLPAVYQEDEESRLFLERFLSIFQSEFDDLDHRIDRLWQLFNPGSICAEHLPWLAAWFALVVNPDWPESKLRSMVKSAFKACLVRGTVVGLKQAIRDYTGVEANIIEHFRLRRLPVLSGPDSSQGGIRLWSPDFYRRLQVGAYSQIGSFRLVSSPEPNIEALAWGAHQFTVCFLANPYESEDIQRRVTQVVEREKPAHTQATICPIFPRFRIGVQATVGTDTVVGGISYLVLNRLANLGYDSILGSSREEAKLRELGSTPHPAVGRSSRLL